MSEHQIDPSRGAALGRMPGPRARSPIPGAIVATTVGALLVLALGSGLAQPAAVLWALTSFLAGALLMFAGLEHGHPHPDFGSANTVTVLRLSLVAVLLAVVLGGTGTGAWFAPALAAAALGLDGLDGWLARRTARVSRFGERFDMEVDSVFAVALTLMILGQDKVGPWVLALAIPRYAFCAAALAFPWLDRPLPPRASRKAACVFQLTVLIALVSPLVGPLTAPPLAAAALAAVVASFARDIRYLWRTR